MDRKQTLFCCCSSFHITPHNSTSNVSIVAFVMFLQPNKKMCKIVGNKFSSLRKCFFRSNITYRNLPRKPKSESQEKCLQRACERQLMRSFPRIIMQRECRKKSALMKLRMKQNVECLLLLLACRQIHLSIIRITQHGYKQEMTATKLLLLFLYLSPLYTLSILLVNVSY